MSCVFCPDNWANLDHVQPPRTMELFPDSGRVAIIRPLDPVTEGHVLAIHETHTENLAQNYRVAADTFAIVAQYLRERRDESFFQANVITSMGPDATQTVFHTHVHIVPRRPNDGLPLPWTPQHEAKAAAALIEIDEKDIRFDIYSTGVADWAMRLTHIPTGIVRTATSDDYSSQLQARAALITRLQDRLQNRSTHT